MKEGYQCIAENHGFSTLRRVRSDNAAPIRAVLFEVMCHAPINVLMALQNIKQRLDSLDALHPHLLEQWSFAGRIKVSPFDTITKVQECLQTLREEATYFANAGSHGLRLELATRVFSLPSKDMMLIEAVKVLMLCL